MTRAAAHHQHSRPIGLSDQQLSVIMSEASDLPIEKRSLFLERTAAMLALRGYSDTDVAEATRLAKRGLVQQPA